MRNTLVVTEDIEEVIWEVDKLEFRFSYHDYRDNTDKEIIVSNTYGGGGSYRDKDDCIENSLEELDRLIEKEYREVYSYLQNPNNSQDDIDRIYMTFYNLLDGKERLFMKMIEHDYHGGCEEVQESIDRIKAKEEKETERYRNEVRKKFAKKESE